MLKAIAGKIMSSFKSKGGTGVADFVKNNKFNTAIAGYSGYSGYKDAKEEGASTAGAVVKGAAEAAIGLLGWEAYLAYFAATELPGMAINGVDALDKYRRRLAKEGSNQAFVNAQFNDTQQTYTMRQRGMAIAQRSQYNMKQAMLGNEAKYMYR